MPAPIYRVSLVEMFVAEEGEDTPRPFLEIRSFIFLDRMPEGVRQENIRRLLGGWIESVKANFLPHIFESERTDIKWEGDVRLSAFSKVRNATIGSRIVIEGFEMSVMDEDELINGHFKQDRKGRRLLLNANVPYLYVAFYNKKGKIKQEYDDSEIKRWMKGVIEIKGEREKMILKAQGLVREIEKKTVQLESTIKELEKTLGRFKRY